MYATCCEICRNNRPNPRAPLFHATSMYVDSCAFSDLAPMVVRWSPRAAVAELYRVLCSRAKIFKFVSISEPFFFLRFCGPVQMMRKSSVLKYSTIVPRGFDGIEKTGGFLPEGAPISGKHGHVCNSMTGDVFRSMRGVRKERSPHN